MRATSRMPCRTSCQLLWNDSIWVRRRERLVKAPSISLQSFLSVAPMTQACPRYCLSCGKKHEKDKNIHSTESIFLSSKMNSEDKTVTLHFLTSPFTFSRVCLCTCRVNSHLHANSLDASFDAITIIFFFYFSFLPLCNYNYIKGLWIFSFSRGLVYTSSGLTVCYIYLILFVKYDNYGTATRLSFFFLIFTVLCVFFLLWRWEQTRSCEGCSLNWSHTFK